MKRKSLLVAIAVVLTIFAFVSCSNEVAPKAEDKLGSITFGSDSRAIGYKVAYSEEVKNLYWYYTAVKLDDGYKTGEKNGYTPVVLDADKNPAQGIDGKTLNSDGFSYGYWKIELRGFASTSDITDPKAAYKATVDNFLVSQDTNVATALIDMAEGAKTAIEFSTDGIKLVEGNIVKTSEFSLAVTDTVGGNTVGKVDTSNAVYTIPDDGGSVTITGLKYVPNADNTDITGTHEMVFTLTQTLKNGNSDVKSCNIIAAAYTLKYIVNKGTTVTIFGDLTRRDDTGNISINGIQSVPELVISKAVDVDPDSVDTQNKVATVSKDTKIEYGDFSVTYPEGALITTSQADGSLSTDKKTSDTTIKFEYQGEEAPGDGDDGKITLVNSNTSEKFDLGLTAAKGNESSDKNNSKLITIQKKVGTGKSFDGVYHDKDKLNKLESLPTWTSDQTLDSVLTQESYHYAQDTGVLTLYLYHASPIYLITKNPVASDGTETYDTLSEAITAAAAQGGSGKVTLLNNLNLNETIEVTSEIELDMNDKVITLVKVGGTTGSITVTGDGVLSVVNRNSEQKDVITGVEKKSYSGESTYYSTFEKALTKPSNGDTITLNKADSLTTSYTPNVSLTIDLNDKSLTVSGGAVIKVETGTITVTGAVENQSAFIEAAESTEESINRTYYPRAVSVGTKYYATIEEAMAAAGEGETVTLLKDVTISKPITVTKNVKLNLAGKTITSSGDNLIYVSYGKLTVSGATGNQTEFVQGAKGSSTTINGDYSPRVARVGSYYYATFEEAVNGAEDGDTVSLLSSVTLSNALVLNKNLTIELNNKTVTIKSFTAKTNVFTLSAKDSGYTVTVKNGKIVTENKADTKINDVFAVGNKAELTLDGVEIDAYASCGIFLINQANPATVTIKDSKIKGMYAYGVGTNATEPANKTFANLTITNSTIETSGDDQDNTGLLVNVPSSVTISGSTISGQRQGVILRGTGTNVVKISSSTIKATGDGTKSYDDKDGTSSSNVWGNGNNIALAALVIGNAKYPGSGYERPTSVELDDVTIELAEGYKGKHIWVVQQNENNTVKVYGDIGPGWTYNSDMNGAEYPTAKVGDTNCYGTLQNAIDAAGENSEIKLCKDVEENLTINGKKLTLDFNGYTIKGGIAVGCKSNYYYANIDKENTEIVFEDSGKNGGVINETVDASALVIKNKSKVTIDGGSFIDRSNGNKSEVIFLDDSTLIINGGSVINESAGKYAYGILVEKYTFGTESNVTSVKVIINAGIFSTKTESYGYIIKVSSAESTLKLDISGGEFKTEGKWGYMVEKPKYGKVTINGGEFSSALCIDVFDVIDRTEIYQIYSFNNNNNIEVNGGKFTVGNDGSYWLKGFVAADYESNDDSVYGYVPYTLKLNGGKINCKNIYKKILADSNCEMVQDTTNTDYYIVTPQTTV